MWKPLASMLLLTLAGGCEQPQVEARIETQIETASRPFTGDNDEFRRETVAFVRAVASGEPSPVCGLPPISTPLQAVVSLYGGGKLLGRGISSQDALCPALHEATLAAIDGKEARENVEQARFVVELTRHGYGMVEVEGGVVELIDGHVPVRSLDKQLLRRRIDEGRAYLLRVMDPGLGGVHKYYHAPSDSFDEQLHTIYTASTVYTLLMLREHDPEGGESLREPIMRGAGFLLEMQRKAPGKPGHGAFHYSLDRLQREREPRFVVGTASKTIFSLILLHELTGDATYMDSARLAADWLLTMQRPDGSVQPEANVDAQGRWIVTERESMLYTGQVLSALSRLHRATGEARWLEAAGRTAQHILAVIDEQGCYLRDDYRTPNPISSSWAILSLYDYAKASGDVEVRTRAYACADDLISRQIDAPEDIYRHGRWADSLSSSGSGWLAEVLATLYLDCPADDADGCERYRRSVIRLLRLLMQYTYDAENSFVARNPDMARGGLFWNSLERDVRTDSVCHAMNAYVFMLDRLPEGPLLELPEAPLATRIQSP